MYGFSNAGVGNTGVRRGGFTLVELSIVLVIIGLLVGGVLAGQSLIRAAELRAVTTEYQRYTTATQAFRDKYLALPGDITNATNFWGNLNGSAANCTANMAGVAITSGTCNGNGNGHIDRSAASQSSEMFQFWRQLALAGLIEGDYTGVAGSINLYGGIDTIPGTNSPKSRMGNSGWGVEYFGVYGGDIYTYAGNYGNMFNFGGLYAGYWPVTATLKPEEAWNIDTKIDDGKPGTGKVFAEWYNACTTSANQTDYAGTYKLTNADIACSLYFAQQF